MPWSPKRPCGKRDCPELVEKGQRFCHEHKREYDREYNRQRPSTKERGFDVRWQRYRKNFLRNHPYCVKYMKCGNMASEIDHIILAKGPKDPLFWKTDNHQPMCKPCHSRKTAKQNGRWGKA